MRQHAIEDLDHVHPCNLGKRFVLKHWLDVKLQTLLNDLPPLQITGLGETICIVGESQIDSFAMALLICACWIDALCDKDLLPFGFRARSAETGRLMTFPVAICASAEAS